MVRQFLTTLDDNTMALLKCIKPDSVQKAPPSSESLSNFPQFPMVENYGSWYKFEDADIDSDKVTAGYSIATDSASTLEDGADVCNNILSVLFIDPNKHYVRVAKDRGEYDDDYHITLCEATVTDIDLLISILTKIKSDL